MSSGFSLRQQLLWIFILGSTLPLALLSVFHARSYGEAFEKTVEGRLQEASVGIAGDVNDRLQVQRSVVLMAAQLIEARGSNDPKVLGEQLQAVVGQSPDFYTMIVIDEKGDVIVRARGQSGIPFFPLPSKPTNVSDRDYFQQVMATRQPFMSNAFLGRTFGNTPIVAFAAPARLPGGHLVVVEGSLNLASFSEIDKRYDTIEDSPVVIEDSQHRVVYSSPELHLNALDDVSKSQIRLAAIDHPGHAFHFQQADGEMIIGHDAIGGTGWHAYIGQPVAVSQRAVRHYYYLTAALALAGIIVSVITAHWLASRISRPLEALALNCRSFLSGGETGPVAVPTSAPREVSLLVEDFDTMQKRLEKVLSGLLPICTHCKSIREESGQWKKLEAYIDQRTEAKLSHGICPECAKRHYPDVMS